MQHIVWLCVWFQFHSGLYDRTQKCCRLVKPLIKPFYLGETPGQKWPLPGLHPIDSSARIHKLHGIVNSGIEILLVVTKLGAYEDTTGNTGDDAEQFAVDVDRSPVPAGRKIGEEGLSGFIGETLIEMGKSGVEAGFDGVRDGTVANEKPGILCMQ